MLRLFSCAYGFSTSSDFARYVCVCNSYSASVELTGDRVKDMSECTTTFRQYHALRLRSAMPAIVLAGVSVFAMSFSLSVLFDKYDDVLEIGLFSAAVSLFLFALAMIVHETFRRLAIVGFTRFVGTDEVVKKRSAIPDVLGLFVIEAVLIFQNSYLWEAGLASWHSRRCVQAEQYEDALAWADEYVRLAPRSPEAYHNRAAVQLKLGEAGLALADYIRAANVDQTRWDTVELLLDQLIEHEKAELFWKIYDLAQPHHAKHAAHYLSSRRDLPNRPPGFPAPADAEPKGTEPHEPDESGQLV